MESTSRLPRVSPERLRTFVLKRVRVQLVLAAAGTAAAWLAYLLALLFDFNLLRFSGKPGERIMGYFVVAIVVSIALGIFAAVVFSKGRGLASRGRLAFAKVARISGISRNGARPVTYSYEVAGRTYEVHRDTPDEEIDTFTPSSAFRVVYDAAKPARSLLIPAGELDLPVASDIHSVSDVAEALSDGMRQGVVAAVPIAAAKVIWGLLFFGQMVALLLLVKQLDKEFSLLSGLPACAAALALTMSEQLVWDKYRGINTASAAATHRLQKILIATCICIIIAWVAWTKFS